MQKLEGDGWVFVQMGGTVIERELGPGEELHVDTGCVAAFTSISFDVIGVGGVKSALFGGEGLFVARLAGRMLAAMPGGGGNRGKGSILGPLGGLIQGNS